MPRRSRDLVSRSQTRKLRPRDPLAAAERGVGRAIRRIRRRCGGGRSTATSLAAELGHVTSS